MAKHSFLNMVKNNFSKTKYFLSPSMPYESSTLHRACLMEFAYYYILEFLFRAYKMLIIEYLFKRQRLKL